MVILILIALAYGSPDMSFPWWVWGLALCYTGPEATVTIKDLRKSA